MKNKKHRSNIIRGRALPSIEEANDVTKSPKPPLAIRTAVSIVKSRKELRRDQRKAKKEAKHQYLLAKCGRDDLVKKAAEGLASSGKKKKKKKKKRKNKNDKKGEGQDQDGQANKGKKGDAAGDEGEESEEEEDEDAKFVQEAVRNQLEQRETIDLALELKNDQKKLDKEVEEVRRKRMIEENEEEEKTINQLSKKLKLNKKAAIPASFKADGLDYFLELCEKGGKKKDVDGEDMSDDEGIEGSEDGSLDMGEDDEDDSEVGGGDSEDLDLEGEEEEEDVDGSDQADEDLDSDVDDEDEEEDDDIEMNLDDEDESGDGEEIESGSKSKRATKVKKNATGTGTKKIEENEEEEDDGVWEDIYGRMRAKDGSVIGDNAVTKPKESSAPAASTGKYVPPALRGNQSQREKLAKQLKGLLNRLSESNMHSIANQVEEMYMANSRNEMNQTLLELLNAVLVRQTLTPERVVLEHVMLIAILHANVGTEVGAFFLQSFSQDFKSKYDAWDSSSNEEDKHLENIVQIISYIYHFKIIHACIIYDVLNFLSDSFKAKDVELILTILRNIGFRLRKDDPAALKDLIITLQQKASKLQSGDANSAKVKFMLEILMAIRNNNMNKIPNYDPSFGEHLLKILKTHLHPGNYVSEMKIGLQDLLNADQVGRWWIVGSAWVGKAGEKQEDPTSISATMNSSEFALKHAKLMKRAREQGMNTDTRRNVFCILMTAEDYMDAFEKLNHLGLRNNQDREIIHVASYCCLQEKKFNPYYGFILSKFCTMDRKLMLALQYNLWDRLKDLNSLTGQQRTNLAHLIVHLINDKSLPLSTLKVIEYAEMDKVKLKFLKKVLTGILLQKEVDNLQEIFIKPALSEKLALFRESLRLFLSHFMLQTSITTSDGSTVECKVSPEDMKALKKRVKIAEKCMTLGKLGVD